MKVDRTVAIMAGNCLCICPGTITLQRVAISKKAVEYVRT